MSSFKRICGTLLAFTVIAITPLRGQAPSPVETVADLDVSEIVSRMVAREKAQAQALGQYTSKRRYRVHNTRFNKTAEMAVVLTCRHAGDKSFEVISQSGPAAMRNRVLMKALQSEVEASRKDSGESAAISTENYNFQLLRVDRGGLRASYVLRAEPKQNKKYLVRGSIWVDAEDFGISKIEAQPAKSPSFWIRSSRLRYDYERLGGFWLPKTTRSEAEVLMFGQSELQIDYDEYNFQ